jgi:hypothetical protein
VRQIRHRMSCTAVIITREKEHTMAFDKPAYPDMLKRRTWDTNKSILAKLKGYTGMGDALEALEDQYDKVDWNIYDLWGKAGGINDRLEKGWTLATLQADIQAAIKDVQHGECKKLSTQALSVRTLAEQLADDYKKSLLIPKKVRNLCRDIARAADGFGIATNQNSMKDKIEAQRKLAMHAIDASIAIIDKTHDKYVKKLGDALSELLFERTYEKWNELHMMTLCRDLNQNVGNVSNLVALGCVRKEDPVACDRFFKEMRPYASQQVPFDKDAPEYVVEGHIKILVRLLNQADDVMGR